jgi:hypothetical protein
MASCLHHWMNITFLYINKETQGRVREMHTPISSTPSRWVCFDPVSWPKNFIADRQTHAMLSWSQSEHVGAIINLILSPLYKQNDPAIDAERSRSGEN